MPIGIPSGSKHYFTRRRIIRFAYVDTDFLLCGDRLRALIFRIALDLPSTHFSVVAEQQCVALVQTGQGLPPSAPKIILSQNNFIYKHFLHRHQHSEQSLHQNVSGVCNSVFKFLEHVKSEIISDSGLLQSCLVLCSGPIVHCPIW